MTANDDFSLTDRVALVTGGNAGLAARSPLPARGGRRRCGHRPRRGKERRRGRRAGQRRSCLLDVGDEAAIERTVAGVVERFARLDILVACAGDFAGGSALDLPSPTGSESSPPI